ncbi:XdhC family protein [Acidithiobacillus sp. M4-SHS-6]|uniref:XdhC family protein n=1 Tax=Acidithiobacillus sp. M4-SHS-6 TaxID=3383024 RepID=UPI0039BDB7DA
MNTLLQLSRQHTRVTGEALVVQVQGSAPTAIGGSVALRDDDDLLGTVGGGHMEYAIVNYLRNIDKKNWPARVEFVLGAKDDQCCGGRVVIALVVVQPLFAELYAPGAARAYQVDKYGYLHLIAGISSQGQRMGDSNVLNLLEKSVVPEFSADGNYFLLPAPQRQTVWIFGAGHVGRALTRLAVGLDFQITLYDDRPEWTNPADFPEDVVLTTSCDQRDFQKLKCANIVLIMTYSHALDYALMEYFTDQPLLYLGVIASQSKAARFRHQLIRASRPIPDNLHMPMGLPGMGKKPLEIAVSILAELLQLRHKGVFS